MRPIVQDLTPPVDPDRDHWRGGERAAVTLVEYGDYQCPYSRIAFHAIGRLEQHLGGQLRFVFRHFPLTDIHPHALAAAHLAEAAALQGLFWPMYQLLFDHQQALTDQDLQGDADSALESGAGGTPTLFINRRLHLGGYDQATLSAALATAIHQQ